MAKSLLIMLPPVQDELKITPKQVDQLKRWSESMRDRGRAFGEQMRQQGPTFDPFRSNQIPLAQAATQITQLMGRMSSLLRENESGIQQILTPTQRKRLDQIALQMEGVTSLARPEVADRLKLTFSQRERIAQAIAQHRTRQLFTFLTQSRAFAAEFARDRKPDPDDSSQPAQATESSAPRPDASPSGSRRSEAEIDGKPDPERKPKDGADTKATADSEPTPKADSESNSDSEVESEARRLERRKQAERVRQKVEDMRSQGDALQSQITQALLKILDDRQRRNFDRMLGPPFDPAAINDFSPRNPPRPSESSPPATDSSPAP
jgi:hypothetical protein